MLTKVNRTFDKSQVCVLVRRYNHIKWAAPILPLTHSNNYYRYNFEDNPYVRTCVRTYNDPRWLIDTLSKDNNVWVLLGGINYSSSGCNITKCPIINSIGHNNQKSQDILICHSFIQKRSEFCLFIGFFAASYTPMFWNLYKLSNHQDI